MRTPIIGAVVLALAAGCAPRVTSTAARDTSIASPVAIIADAVRDRAGARDTEAEAAVRDEAGQALVRAGHTVAALRRDLRDLDPPGRSLDVTPVSDADAGRLAEANAVRWIVVIAVTHQPVAYDGARVPAEVSARLVDAQAGTVVWGATATERGLFLGDGREALRRLAREVVEALPAPHR